MRLVKWLSIFSVLTAILATCIAAAGCRVPHASLVRPDGSPVPFPNFATNVVPWAYTNQVAR